MNRNMFLLLGLMVSSLLFMSGCVAWGKSEYKHSTPNCNEQGTSGYFDLLGFSHVKKPCADPVPAPVPVSNGVPWPTGVKTTQACPTPTSMVPTDTNVYVNTADNRQYIRVWNGSAFVPVLYNGPVLPFVSQAPVQRSF